MKAPRHLSSLGDALQHLAGQGRTARFWLRDDDAVEPTPALDHLLDLGQRYAVPIALAVIPARADWALARRLAQASHATPLVHGWAHANHAQPGEKKQELDRHRASEIVIAEMSRALRRMTALFGDRLSPVLVPPWNRVEPGLLKHLPDLGYRAISAFGKVPAQMPLPTINTHADVMDWHGTGGCRDHSILSDEIARLVMTPENGQAVGILTHHLVHDESVWQFVEKLFELTAGSSICRWLSIADLLGEYDGIAK